MNIVYKSRVWSLVCVLVLIPATAFAECTDDASVPSDDSVFLNTSDTFDAGHTDADVALPGDANLMDASGGPIAFGTVNKSGVKQSGTSNWNSLYKSSNKRYEVKINGENYYYLKYTTVITPAGDVGYCRSSSVGGKLLIYCYNKAGNGISARFGFATFKAP
jgi:hypothetical protein